MDVWAFILVVVGESLGFTFLMFLDKVVPHLHMHSEKCEGFECKFQKSMMMILALAIGIAIRNFPEGAIISVPFHNKGIKKKIIEYILINNWFKERR